MVDNVFSETDQNKILTSDEIVAFLARAFKDGCKDATWVFNLLDDAKKVQVRALALCSTLCLSVGARALLYASPCSRARASLARRIHPCVSLYHPLIAYRSTRAAGVDVPF